MLLADYTFVSFFDKFVASLSKSAWAYGDITTFSEILVIGCGISDLFWETLSWFWDFYSDFNLGLNYTNEPVIALFSSKVPFSSIILSVIKKF